MDKHTDLQYIKELLGVVSHLKEEGYNVTNLEGSLKKTKEMAKEIEEKEMKLEELHWKWEKANERAEKLLQESHLQEK